MHRLSKHRLIILALICAFWTVFFLLGRGQILRRLGCDQIADPVQVRQIRVFGTAFLSCSAGVHRGYASSVQTVPGESLPKGKSIRVVEPRLERGAGTLVSIPAAVIVVPWN